MLEDFRGKDYFCAFVANWLQGKGLNKPSLVAYLKYLNFKIFNIGLRL